LFYCAGIEKKLMKYRSYEPVFIIGAARSGTKMLRDLIAMHPMMDRVPYDINFIWRLGNESIPHDELVVENITPQISRMIQDKLGKFHQGRRFLIEKTVSNCLRVPFVDTIFPDAKYIFLIRNGYDVVESVYRQWISPPDWKYLMVKARSFPFIDAPGYALNYVLNMMKKPRSGGHKTWGPRYQGIDEDVATKDLLEVCAIQWSRSVEKAFLWLEKIATSRRMVIKYEDFVNRPQQYLVGIADFLSIDSAPCLDSTLLDCVNTTNIGKGRHQLTQAQQALLLPYIQHTTNTIGTQWVEVP
jgi:hypothetical protein